jgi:tRNA modification GTPase
LDGAGVDRNPDEGGGERFAISAAQGDGVQALVVWIAGFARNYFGGGESALIGRQRHRDLLRNTADMLQRSIGSVALGEEVIAEELRIAVQYLGQLLGRVDVEDLLDVIFREFCVGK